MLAFQAHLLRVFGCCFLGGEGFAVTDTVGISPVGEELSIASLHFYPRFAAPRLVLILAGYDAIERPCVVDTAAGVGEGADRWVNSTVMDSGWKMSARIVALERGPLYR